MPRGSWFFIWPYFSRCALQASIRFITTSTAPITVSSSLATSGSQVGFHAENAVSSTVPISRYIANLLARYIAAYSPVFFLRGSRSVRKNSSMLSAQGLKPATRPAVKVPAQVSPDTSAARASPVSISGVPTACAFSSM